MQIYDTIVLLIILIAGFSGWRKGLASQIASIVSLAASCWVATTYPGVLATKIDAAPPWNGYAAMLILFLGTSVVTWIVFRQIRGTIDKLKLGEFDHQMGALFGALKGFILASIVTLVAVGFLTEGVRNDIINTSKSGGIIAGFLYRVRPYVPERAMTYVAPFFSRLDEIRPGGFSSGAIQVNQEYSPGTFPQQDYIPYVPPGNQPPVYQPPYPQNAGPNPAPGSTPWQQPPQTSGNPDWGLAPPSGGRY